ncbi:pirin family protein [Cruoricaptor ignavus]|uniref:Pirin family protein n=2 Tax=Cruoricaptor ignavus TaxID=1118202 RepID=A0A7M1T4J4_9FLAO|nr:pirin family protein [Cruoricaptor ignavus]QOR74074.1 pirin family protein [Cruoricaptor ignavus]
MISRARENNPAVPIAKQSLSTRENLYQSTKKNHLPKVDVLAGYNYLGEKTRLNLQGEKSNVVNYAAGELTGSVGQLYQHITGNTPPPALQQQFYTTSQNIVSALYPDGNPEIGKQGSLLAGVFVRQPLYLGGKLKAAQELASIQAESGRYNLENVQDLASYTATVEYIQVLYANSMIAMQEKMVEAQNCRFVILTNGNQHYLWDLKRGNPNIISRFPTPETIESYQEFKPNPSDLVYFNQNLNKMRPLKFLIVGKNNEDGMATLQRVVQKTENWHAGIAHTVADAQKYLEQNPTDILLISAGLSPEEENQLREAAHSAGIIPITHYGGGSGLLKNEIFQQVPEIAEAETSHKKEETIKGKHFIFIPAQNRAVFKNDLVTSFPTFSFGDYYDSDRLGFGALRVLNDDIIEAEKGFGTHPHDNMEIISIPVTGVLQHRDTLDNVAIIRSLEVQVMSAGTGLFHSEHNHSDEKDATLLQIWIYPKERNTPPKYDKITFSNEGRQNRFQQIISPDKDDEGGWIYQDAWLHLGSFGAGQQASYTLKNPENGVYIMTVSGTASANGHLLNPRDGLGLWDSPEINIEFTGQGAEVLIIEVPMKQPAP